MKELSRADGMAKQARELIYQTFERGYKNGYEDSHKYALQNLNVWDAKWRSLLYWLDNMRNNLLAENYTSTAQKFEAEIKIEILDDILKK